MTSHARGFTRKCTAHKSHHSFLLSAFTVSPLLSLSPLMVCLLSPLCVLASSVPILVFFFCCVSFCVCWSVCLSLPFPPFSLGFFSISVSFSPLLFLLCFCLVFYFSSCFVSSFFISDFSICFIQFQCPLFSFAFCCVATMFRGTTITDTDLVGNMKAHLSSDNASSIACLSRVCLHLRLLVQAAGQRNECTHLPPCVTICPPSSPLFFVSCFPPFFCHFFMFTRLLVVFLTLFFFRHGVPKGLVIQRQPTRFGNTPDQMERVTFITL